MPRRPRAGADCPELEHIPVEEGHQLAPLRRLANGLRKRAHAVGHGLLLVLDEVEDRPFGRRVAEDAGRSGVPGGGGGHCRCGERHLSVAPRRLQAGVGLVAVLQPGAEVPLVTRGVPVQQVPPRVHVEPLAGVLPAGMVAGHVVAELLFQVCDQRGDPRGRVLPVLRRRHDGGVLAGAVFPDHHVLGMRPAPALLWVDTEPWQQQRLGVGLQHLLALGVDGGPVLGLTGLGPREVDREADEVYADFRGELDLRGELARRTAQVRVRRARSVHSHHQFARRFRPRPEADAVVVPLQDWQLGVAVDVEVRPGSVGRRLQVHVQAGGPLAADARLDLHTADRVLLVGRPEAPVRGESPCAALEVARRQGVAAGVEIGNMDVVKVDVARRLPPAEVERTAVFRILRRGEVERLHLASGTDRHRPASVRAPEHPRADRLAVHHQPRRTVGGFHPHGEGESGCLQGECEGGGCRKDSASGHEVGCPFENAVVAASARTWMHGPVYVLADAATIRHAQPSRRVAEPSHGVRAA